jgi:hypothetical protein
MLSQLNRNQLKNTFRALAMQIIAKHFSNSIPRLSEAQGGDT